jgi:hypothetical protein
MTVSTSAGTAESTPLLSSCVEQTYDAPYNRFTPAKKRMIVALCAGVGFMPCVYSHEFLWSLIADDSPVLVADSFVPAIPLIVDDLNSTPTTVAYDSWHIL